MLIELVERLLWIIFWLSTCNIIRHAYFFIQTWVKSDGENPEKYYLSYNSLLFLGLSIGYLITAFIKGINL